MQGCAPIRHGTPFHEKYLWDWLRPIMPYPTGRYFRGTLSQALRAWLAMQRGPRPGGTVEVEVRDIWRRNGVDAAYGGENPGRGSSSPSRQRIIPKLYQAILPCPHQL